MIFNVNFKKYLSEKAAMEEDYISRIFNRAEKEKTPLYEELVKFGNMDEETVFRITADFLGVPYRFYDVTELDLAFIRKFRYDKIAEYSAIPVYIQDGVLFVLTSDPIRFEEIRSFLSDGGRSISLIIACPSRTQALIEFINNRNIQQDSALADGEEEKNFLAAPEIESPAVNFCNSVVRDAVTVGASDIHIEPYEGTIRIRFRVDGVLQKSGEFSPQVYPSVLARFKIMAGMDIAERRVPQDGKISIRIDGRDYDLRVSTVPTIHGEKVEIRIYDLDFSYGEMDKLGLTDEQIATVKEIISGTRGIILLTGPTGSGKSTSLYTFLRYLNSGKENIIAVEDPVENEIDGISQIQVNAKSELTFATALRAILRQDPDIIMIGEIRDEETAHIAIRAAITGRLVFSTLHTGNAAGVVARLIDMGIPRYLVADALLCSISQRLVRLLCPECKKAAKATLSESHILGIPEGSTIYKGVGCPYCGGTGYRGRTAVFEMMRMTPELREKLVRSTFTGDRLKDLLSNGIPTLSERVRDLVVTGKTSFEEYQIFLNDNELNT